MTNDQLLVEVGDALAEARDVVDRLERAYIILCGERFSETPGRLIHLDRSRTLRELAEEARGA